MEYVGIANCCNNFQLLVRAPAGARQQLLVMRATSVSEATIGKPQREGFRADINGLRAWAVVAVVLYHFGVPGVGAGFAGVDVFFVISGFLMCGIIVSGLQGDSFSVWRFYLARAQRIFPALIILCAVALVCGWFLLMPEEYQQLGRHARESLLFTSNLRYFDESGYFDVASKEKWLLHTWSLSVEWQFYMLLPLLLLLVWKLRPNRRALTSAVLLLFGASLGWCLWRTPGEPGAAFYLLQSRAWEMLAGGLVYLLGGRLALSGPARRLLELLGFALILATLLVLDRHSQWPGWRAMLPVAGAGLVLLAARKQSRWTGTRVAQWLGTRSYSIYLWHWPLVVALAYLEQLANPLWIGSGLLLSLLLGHLSYVLVEAPSQRRMAALSNRRAALVLLLSLALLAVFAQQVRRSGFPERLPAEIAKIEAESENDNPRIKDCLDPAANCIYGEQPVRAILIGDSHADAVVTALQASLPGGQGGIFFKGGSGCLISFGMRTRNDKPYCDALNNEIEAKQAQLYPGVPVVIVGRTSEYVRGGVVGDASQGRPTFYFSEPVDSFSAEFLEEFRGRYLDTMCQLASQHPLFIVRPIPEMGVDVPTLMGRAMLMGKTREITLAMADYQRRHAYVWALQDEAAQRCGARLLDPLLELCDAVVCRSNLEGRPLYRDGDHLSEFGNRLLIPMFSEIFRQSATSGQ